MRNTRQDNSLTIILFIGLTYVVLNLCYFSFIVVSLDTTATTARAIHFGRFYTPEGTFIIATGIIGLCLFIYSIVYSIFKYLKTKEQSIRLSLILMNTTMFLNLIFINSLYNVGNAIETIDTEMNIQRYEEYLNNPEKAKQELHWKRNSERRIREDIYYMKLYKIKMENKLLKNI